jgi:hypothetical protein
MKGGAVDPRQEVGGGLTAGPQPSVTGAKRKRRGAVWAGGVTRWAVWAGGAHARCEGRKAGGLGWVAG